MRSRKFSKFFDSHEAIDKFISVGNTDTEGNMKFNREKLWDKIYACWLGKNLGGTIGTPYEAKREIQNATGFVTPPGEPLINDDLDLQLVWLRAVEELGVRAINERVLGEYWLTYITPHWNEYGVGKSNMKAGIVPPMSGEVNNEEWRNSNGAWIRTEIWASLFPGQPERAIRYAYYDACVDHGFGEGTFAAIFVEAMESAAFVISDLRELIRIGLSKIPENCRVARSVRLAVEEYDKGTEWKDTRNKIVEDSKDLGWFQAPANVAFTILGLLYGEGDFKRSMLTAVNCGDDTDCTGATCGALLGIMYGTEIIPKDWREYLGDRIVSGCLLHGHAVFPKSCTELTDKVIELLPVTSQRTPLLDEYREYRDTPVEVYDGDNDFDGVSAETFAGSSFADALALRGRYYFEAENLFAKAEIELERAPYIKPGETIKGRIRIKEKLFPEKRHYSLRFLTEDGFTVKGNLNLHTCSVKTEYSNGAVGEFVITALETVKAENRIVLEIVPTGRFTPIYATLILFG